MNLHTPKRAEICDCDFQTEGALMLKLINAETQMMSHIVESCPLTKLNCGLSRLHSADEDAVSWLTNYGS